MTTHFIADEKYFIKKSLELIEEKAAMGKKETWTNSNFIDLGFEISKISRISISANTLKRLFGKVKTNEEYIPQQATKEAIAIYLGYDAWKTFRQKMMDELVNHPAQAVTTDLPNETPVLEEKKKHLWIIPIIVILCLTIGIIFILINKRRIEFNGRYLTGKAYHTAVFRYRVPNHSNYFIDFGNGMKTLLNPSDSIASSYFQLPDVYHVALMKDDKIIKKEKVWITTNGWEGFINLIEKNPPRYTPFNISGDTLTTTIEEVVKNGFDTTKIFWTYFCNMHDYHISGDDFKFSADLENNRQITDVRCNHIRVEIIGEEERIGIYFVKPGCSNWVKLQFSEQVLDGYRADMTTFSRDFGTWKNIVITNKNKHVQIDYDTQKIFEFNYQTPVGAIKGIRISFTGIGAAKNVLLNNNPQ